MKKYERPDMEIVMFEDEDVITTSGSPTPTCRGELTCPIYCKGDTCQSDVCDDDF